MILPILVLIAFLILWHPWAAPAPPWHALAEPYRFSIVYWEAQTLLGKGQHELAVLGQAERAPQARRQAVEAYFAVVKQMEQAQRQNATLSLSKGEHDLAALEGERAVLEDSAEDAIEAQIGHVLQEEGLALKLAPWAGADFEIVFPPVNLELDPLPHLLVISPRERIELVDAILLRETLSQQDIDHLESEVERLGVSALVTDIGGLATYPYLIPGHSSLERCLTTTSHEWLHSYLFFFPLGRHYGDSYQMRTINETAASMGGQELGRLVLRKYYAEAAPDLFQPQSQEAPDSKFHKVLRETRLAVDRYLAQGQVEEAEALMEEARRALAAEGYYIRRLNQAYFAFHGAYADSPASVSPIGTELAQLRAKSGSLGKFIRAVSGISSYDELKALLR